MPKKTLTDTRLYPVIIHREGETWGYFSPEFGGGGAPTSTDAVRLAQEMMDAAVAELAEAGQDIPQPSDFMALDAEGGQVICMAVTYSDAAERVTLTLPKALLARIDAATTNRSAFLAELARERLGSNTT